MEDSPCNVHVVEVCIDLLEGHVNSFGSQVFRVVRVDGVLDEGP